MNIPRRQVLQMAWGLGGAVVSGAWARAPSGSPPTTSLHWHETALLAFGTTVWLRAAHADAAKAARGVQAATAAIQRVDQQMSLFRPDSEIVRLNRDGILANASPELVDVLRTAKSIARATDGLFDPTVQPLWRLWHDAAMHQRRPSPDARLAAQRLVDWRRVDVQTHRIAFKRTGMAITLNGIAQGYAADLAAAALRQSNIEHALLQSGEWLPMGRSSDGAPWRLGVADPHRVGHVLATLRADGRAIACSSDDRMSFSADHRDHHILDPRNGQSPTQLSTVVVMAPTCTLADALTKPMMMGSAAQALALARRWQVDVLTVDKRGRMVASSGLDMTVRAS